MALYTLAAKLTADAKQFISEINRAKTEMTNLQKFSAKVGERFADFGNSIGKTGDSLTTKITKPAVAAGTAVAGITFAKGFQRLVSIDTAQAKLKALGHDAKSVGKIMDSALTSVKGTSYGLGEAATTAASAVAAGIKPGKELTRYLTLTGDAAAIAGTGMGEMGSIFNKVTTANKAYNGELQQLSDRGIPIYGFLAEQAGVSEDAIFKMASEGKISSEMFLKAIEENIGGAAGIMGAESFVAGAANVGAAIGRLGAAFLDAGGKGGGFFSTLKPLMADFVTKIDSMGTIAEQAGVKFGEMFITAIEKVKEIKQWYDDLSPTMQNIINKTVLWGSIGAVSIGPILQIVGKVSTVFGFLGTSVIPKVINAFKLIGPTMTFLNSPIGIIIALIAVLVGAFIYAYNTSETFREKVHSAFNAVRDVISEVITAVSGFIMGIWGQVVAWWSENNEMIKQAAENVWNVISTVISVAMDVIHAVMSVLWPIIKMLIVDTWENIKNVIQGAIDIILGIIIFFSALFTGDWSALWDATKQILSGAVQLLWGLVNLWFIGKILKVGKSFASLFKNVFSTVWNAIKSIFSGSVSIVKNVVSTGFNFIRSIISGIMNGVRAVISTIWNAIKSVISTVLNAIKTKVTNDFNSIKNIATTVFNAVKNAMTKPIEKARDIIKTALDKIKGFFGGLKLKFPKIQMPKLPKFSLNGSFSLNPPSVPKLSVSWHAKGGIFNRPTLLGDGSHGVGEAGPEAVLPLNSKVLGGIGQGIARTISIRRTGENDNIYVANAIKSLENTLSNLSMNMDGREVARIIKDDITAMQKFDDTRINIF